MYNQWLVSSSIMALLVFINLNYNLKLNVEKISLLNYIFHQYCCLKITIHIIYLFIIHSILHLLENKFD